MTDQAQGYPGQQGLTDPNSDHNAMAFAFEQLLGYVRTLVPVEVVAVTPGGLAGEGQVDVRPLVNQMDGAGNGTPHGLVLSLPVFRLRGGTAAVILDPAVGDVGLAVVADRDVSAVKATGAQANPGSFRRFDLADSFYLGGVLNGGPPARYVLFSALGVTIADGNANQIQMRAGFVNVVTPVFQVNGVPVTVP